MRDLKDRIFAAFAASQLGNATDIAARETQLMHAFDTVFGGEDISRTIGNGIRRCYIMSTTVERDVIIINAYGGTVLPVDGLAHVAQYPVVGYGVFMRCLIGEHTKVHGSIEAGYRAAAEMMGSKAFREQVGKALPYRADKDDDLFRFSAGIVDIQEGEGCFEDPLLVRFRDDRRFRLGSCNDLRKFDELDGLIGGICAAWSTLVSAEQRDWEDFISHVGPAFTERMENVIPF